MTQGPILAHEPIAICGVGCRFPGGAHDPESFWQLLASKTDAIGPPPNTRWTPERFFDPDPKVPGRMSNLEAGFVDWDPTQFDAAFFGISPREADTMDPQQRLLLEVCWEAFEHAGVSAESLAGSRTGVFIGGFSMDYHVLQFHPAARRSVSAHTGTGATMAILSNRISYTFDFRGPSLTVDTACSASLTALHLAVRSIRSGESEGALVGGVTLLLNPVTSIAMSKGHFLAPDGRCKSFDSRADGYTRGEGAGVVYLEPLSRAQAQGRRILAVVLGTAANQDGRTSGITVPRPQAQEQVIRAALADAAVAPESVHYVESHGTGTPVGDPIEARALGRVLGLAPRKAGALVVGALKTNIGHLEAAAGVASVIKAALCLQRREVPPNLHLVSPNPDIDLPGLGLTLASGAHALPEDTLAGINGFGYGCSNAHVILGPAPRAVPTNDGATSQVPVERAHFLPLSARSEGALLALAGELHARLGDVADDTHSFTEFCRAAAQRRGALRVRACVFGGRADMRDALLALSHGEPHAHARSGSASEGQALFVFSGMGPQWHAMGRQLADSEPVFARALDEVDELFTAIAGWSIREELQRDADDSRMARADVAQPANFAVQVGLTRLLQTWGLQPQLVLGHSIGEVAAAWASGGLSLADAVTVVFHRSRLQQTTEGRGGMLAVAAAPETVEQIIARHPGVEVAAFNGPMAATLVGDEALLSKLASELREAAEPITAKALRVAVPYHSCVMDDIRDELLSSLGRIRPGIQRIPMISSVTGKAVAMRGLAGPYWWRNVREPVRFDAAIRQAVERGANRVIELGPHPVLSGNIRQIAADLGAKLSVGSTLKRREDEHLRLAATVAEAFCAGAKIDWPTLAGPSETWVDLPLYPWQRREHWNEALDQRSERTQAPAGWLGLRQDLPGRAWVAEFSPSSYGWLAEHQLDGSPVVAGALWITLAAEAARAQGAQRAGVIDLQLKKLTAVPEHEELIVSTAIAGAGAGAWQVTMHVREREAWQLAAQASLVLEVPDPRPASLPELQSRLTRVVPVAEAYAALSNYGFAYGPPFRTIESLWAGDDEVLARLDASEALPGEPKLDPRLLDGGLQSLVAARHAQTGHRMIPSGVAEVRVFDGAGTPRWCHARVSQVSTRRMVGDIVYLDDEGEVAVELIGIECTIVSRPMNVDALLYALAWPQDELPDERVDGPWCVVGPTARMAAAAQALEKAGAVVVPATTQGANILDLWLLDQDPSSDEQLGAETCDEAVGALQRLQEGLRRGDKRIVLATRGALHTGDESQVDPRASVSVSLARSAAFSTAETRFVHVDLDRDSTLDDLAKVAVRDLRADQVALRGDELRTPRIRNSVPEPEPLERRPAQGCPFRLVQRRVGRLDSFAWVQLDRRAPGAGEVEVAIDYVTLNFKDLAKAMGMLSDQTLEGTRFGYGLGCDFSGRIAAVGPGVEGLAVGDEVFGAADSAFRSHQIVPSDLVRRRPPDRSLVQSANVITWMTAWHSLCELGRIRPGDRVLVHSAAGGVGLAVLAMALAKGASVFATAGTQEKRQLLLERGAAAVGDSRSSSFGDAVMRWSEGEGVDIVVNTLTGERLARSLRVLAPYGRFIELGKRDIEVNAKLDLQPFNENLSFFALDLDRVMMDQPKRWRHCQDELHQFFVDNPGIGLPTRVIPAAEIEEAFRTMAQAQHVGKLTICLSQAPELEQAPSRWPRNDDVWLLTGGLTGLGSELAGWLVAQGARRLVLLGRRGIDTPGAAQRVAALEAQGAQVAVVAADVTDRAALARAFDEAQARFDAPISGIVHGAMVLEDTLFADLDAECLARVLAPKVLGAWNLHAISRERDLPIRAFLMMSSVTALSAAMGQANYSAANAFLDALAGYRRAQGLAATSIQWGLFEDIGVAAQPGQAHMRKHVHKMGIRGFEATHLHRVLDVALRAQPEPTLGAWDADWAQFGRTNLRAAATSRFADVLSTGSADGVHPFRRELLALSPKERKARVLGVLSSITSRVLRIAAADLRVDAPFSDLGIDSIMVVEIVTAVAEITGETLSTADASGAGSLEGLASLLASRVEAQDLPAQDEAAKAQASAGADQ